MLTWVRQPVAPLTLSTWSACPLKLSRQSRSEMATTTAIHSWAFMVARAAPRLISWRPISTPFIQLCINAQTLMAMASMLLETVMLTVITPEWTIATACTAENMAQAKRSRSIRKNLSMSRLPSWPKMASSLASLLMSPRMARSFLRPITMRHICN